MTRCYIRPEEWTGDELALSPGEAHHVQAVLRAEPGRRVEIFNGQGGQGEAEIVSVSGRRVAVRVVRRFEVPAPLPRLLLVQAVPRERKMDFILQKAVELGVQEIVPVIADRCVVRIPAADAPARVERWRAIALNAAKQCGAAWLPCIAPAAPFRTALGTLPPLDLFIVGALGAGARPLKELVRACAAPPASIGVLIGPEGDLTTEELAAAIALGAVPAGFGRLTLRVETAALFALSVLQYEFENTVAVLGHDGGGNAS